MTRPGCYSRTSVSALINYSRRSTGSTDDATWRRANKGVSRQWSGHRLKCCLRGVSAPRVSTSGFVEDNGVLRCKLCCLRLTRQPVSQVFCSLACERKNSPGFVILTPTAVDYWWNPFTLSEGTISHSSGGGTDLHTSRRWMGDWTATMHL